MPVYQKHRVTSFPNSFLKWRGDGFFWEGGGVGAGPVHRASELGVQLDGG